MKIRAKKIGVGGLEGPAQPRKKRFFLRGLVTVLPAVLTVFILFTVVQFAENYVTGPINSVIYWTLEGNALGWKVLRVLGLEPHSVDYLHIEALPADLQQTLEEKGLYHLDFQEELDRHRADQVTFFRDLHDLAIDPVKLRRAVRRAVHPMVGVMMSLLLVLTLGYLASGYLGRRLLSGLDRTLLQVPVVRSVYPYTKQVVDFFLSEKQLELGSVVAVPYPSEGIWSIGFVTSSGLKSVHEHEGGPFVSIFIPSSPLPMTGYTIFVALHRLIPLDITIDEALRTTVSAGVLIPPQQRVEGLEELMRSVLGDAPGAARAGTGEGTTAGTGTDDGPDAGRPAP